MTERQDIATQLLDPIRGQDRPRLREIATDLKQTDGEHWAVGEMLERACILLDALEAQADE